jgi:TorA maturation chaperone TorD
MESIARNTDGRARFAPYASIRADSYVMLAALLGQPPSNSLLKILQDLQWDELVPERVKDSLRALRQAGHDYPLVTLEDEYDRLFVGLGCGEVVPYASWYRERAMRSSLLVSLRSDLILLGIVKQADSHEPEDHAAVLCECMALISQKPNGVDRATQARFFHQHMAPWMTAFFQDLYSAKSARFYRAVGSFGSQFMETETEYLANFGPV